MMTSRRAFLTPSIVASPVQIMVSPFQPAELCIAHAPVLSIQPPSKRPCAVSYDQWNFASSGCGVSFLSCSTLPEYQKPSRSLLILTSVLVLCAFDHGVSG